MRSPTFVSLVVLACLALTARADLQVYIDNGDRVTGSISPVEEEVYLVDVPGGAKLTVTLQGKKTKSAAKPVMDLEIRDSTDDVLFTTSGAKGNVKAKVTANLSGAHRLIVTSEGTGHYQIKVKWKSIARLPLTTDMDGPPVETALVFGADERALVTAKIKPAKGSGADPRFDRIDTLSDSVDLPDPLDGEKGHKIKNVPTVEFGNQSLVMLNDGVTGPVKGSLRVKAPPPTKRRLDVSDDVIGGDGEDGGIGVIVSFGGGTVGVDGDDLGGIGGAAVNVPAGALTQPTVIIVSSSPTIEPPSGDVEGAGPTVFFGPEGLTFELPVTVVIPYDPAFFMGDFTGLAIYTRDGNGNVTLVPGPYDTSVPGIVSVQVSHFSSFRVFGPPRAASKFDLNADGADDLVATAPGAGANAEGKVYVFFGPFTTDQDLDSSDADVTIVGTQVNGNLGERYAVADASGDGTADLLVYRKGEVLIFHGGPGFSPTTDTGANQKIVGDVVGTNFAGAIAVGDVNGDERPDLIIGDEGADNSRGRAYVFFGSASGVFANNGSLADAVFTGEQDDDLFGAVVASGDVNDDGVDDVVVGADTVDRAGALYVFPGSASLGSATAPIIIRGNTPLGGFGLTIVVGDVNGDGVDDIVAGEGSDSPNDNPGAVYVFAGGTSLPGGLADALASRKYTGFGANDRLGSSLKLADLGGTGELAIVALAPFHNNVGALYVLAFAIQSGQVGATQANVVGENNGPLRVLLDPIRSGGATAVTAAAPTYDDGTGRVYLFLQAHTGGDSAANAEVLINGVNGEGLGGGGLD